MLIDLTVQVSKETIKDAQGNEKWANLGHLGTHFDVMNKEFPIEFAKRKAVIFDVSSITDRDIEAGDIDISKVERNTFVAFYTGYIDREAYGTKAYFTNHPQLSDDLIDQLIAKGISIIGIDCAGIRRGKEHTPKDQYCADHNVFVVENLYNLKEVAGKGADEVIIYTFPIKFANMTGLPCRVVAELNS